jgi:hypothetical protein
LFGCIGLNNKQYCIFNKQYTKEEYETLVLKVIQHMNAMPYNDKSGIAFRYGEFFPFELSVSPYNETLAQEYFPLSKEEAIRRGYFWRDDTERNYAITKKAEELPDRLDEVQDSIFRNVIGCQHRGSCGDGCATAFKLTLEELVFYRRFNLPLPRLCFNCRHANRLEQRNLPFLYRRVCDCVGEKSKSGVYSNTALHSHSNENCLNQFRSPYAPERPEIVYCEQCYQAEVV